MDWWPREHPVLRQLAVVRAARDFGLGAGDVDTVALRSRPTPVSVAALADALADLVVAERAPS